MRQRSQRPVNLYPLGAIAWCLLACGGLAIDCLPDAPCGASTQPFEAEQPGLQPSDNRPLPPDQPPTGAADGVSSPENDRPLPPAPVSSLCPEGQPLGDPSRPPEVQSWVLLTQSQINGLAGCQQVLGNLTIVGGPETDLSPLSELHSVEGAFTLQGSLDPDNPLLGRLSRIEALSQLQRVGSLHLTHLATSSLVPLSNLTNVGLDDATTLASFRVDGIYVVECDNLQTLEGLHNIETYDSLALLDNDSLVDFQDLQEQEDLSYFQFSGNPRLRQLAYSPRRVRTGLSFTNSAFEDVEPMSNLVSARSVHVQLNSALRTLEGLRNLEDFVDMRIDSNAQLQSLPVWDQIDDLGNLRILNNPALMTGPNFPALERLARGQIFVTRNASLPSLNGLSSLQRARTLVITENASLREINLLSLDTVSRTLEVRCNPQLAPTSLEPLTQINSESLILQDNGGNAGNCTFR